MGRFADALARPGLQAIAEVKRRSPSAGDLRPDADPAQLAASFAHSGAAAISVLVDERFGGQIADLAAARAATDAPLLGKGFFTEEDDLRALKEAGAEAHTADEVERAVALEAPIVGVNARDLSTFAIDRKHQLELVARIPGDRVVVAESGVYTRAQGASAELAGADAILVGSSLMKAPDPAAKLRELLSRPLVKVCGMTNQEDVDQALEAGADLVGFIFAEGSPRRAPALLDVPETALSVAVFVGDAPETESDLVQLYAAEAGMVRGRDAVLLRDGAEVAQVADLPWEGQDPNHYDDARAREGERLMLAGKLGPENVAEAIRRVEPWAVDAASSLELEPGRKDHARVTAFIQAARA
jgi:indole-3-glycerol phosphate synthase